VSSWIIKIQLRNAKKERYWGGLGTVLHKKEAFCYSSEASAKQDIVRIAHQSNIPVDRFSVIASKEKSNLYGAQPVCVFPDSDTLYQFPKGQKPTGAEWFASKLEARTFLLLRKYFNRKNIYLQYPLLIKPDTPLYPKLEWRVDFAILEPRMYIEAKGEALPEFKRAVQLFQYFNQRDFYRLTVIGDTRERIDKVVTKITLDEFEEQLQRLKL
jgi:hypothetical protein